MTYDLAYTIGFGESTTTIRQSFQTEAARNQFVTSKMPNGAKNIRIWPRPKNIPAQRNLWWEENKRPFADRFVEKEAM